jgi:hypothetical protein
MGDELNAIGSRRGGVESSGTSVTPVAAARSGPMIGGPVDQPLLSDDVVYEVRRALRDLRIPRWTVSLEDVRQVWAASRGAAGYRFLNVREQGDWIARVIAFDMGSGGFTDDVEALGDDTAGTRMD